MKRVLVSELIHWLGKDVVVKGWVHRLRYLSNVVFLILRDRTGQIQVAVDPELLRDLSLSTESVVEIQGIVKAEPRAKDGFEIEAQSIKALSQASELPLTINGPSLDASLETILDNRTLSLRHEKIHPIFKIQAALAHGFQRFLNEKGFVRIFTPKIVKGGTEGGTELFSVQYFQEKAYLAQSPQFYKQMMVGAGYERVYEVGHVYRAERHATTRHLNEYISLDLEMAFIDSEEDLMDLENELLDSIFSYAAQHCAEELKILDVNVPPVPPQIPRIPVQTAIDLLKEVYGKEGVAGDLDPEGERLLCQYIKETTGSDFVFVTLYPWEKRPMYTMPKEKGLTGSFDLLFRGLEITTGGQRIHDYAHLRANMIKKGLNPADFEDYLVNFKQGMPPHGGLAIGLERLTTQILGLRNVREAALFPRDRHRLAP